MALLSLCLADAELPCSSSWLRSDMASASWVHMSICCSQIESIWIQIFSSKGLFYFRIICKISPMPRYPGPTWRWRWAPTPRRCSHWWCWLWCPPGLRPGRRAQQHQRHHGVQDHYKSGGICIRWMSFDATAEYFPCLKLSLVRFRWGFHLFTYSLTF